MPGLHSLPGRGNVAVLTGMSFPFPATGVLRLNKERTRYIGLPLMDTPDKATDNIRRTISGEQLVVGAITESQASAGAHGMPGALKQVGFACLQQSYNATHSSVNNGKGTSVFLVGLAIGGSDGPPPGW
jgi:hypothetical protein